jgi:peptidoglycan biosynthesis protein MviN/MurJ (putative lipid II flippase)
MFVFNLSMIYDTIAVARLVQIRERDGDAAFWRTSNRLLLQAILGGVLCAAGIMVVLWLTMPVVAAGFSAAERDVLWDLAKYFLPWIAVVIPYYAVSAHLKALWRFQWVFSVEIVAMVISIGVLVLHHQDVASLPIAYGCGYAGALVLLLMKRGIRRGGSETRPQGLLRGMSQQYLAIQIGNAAGLADRYYQSYILPGGISALGYSGLIVNSLASLLTFREIYVVPLASETGRNAKLDRILQGLVLLSIPCMGFLVIHAEAIIGVLFQRGSFTSDDTAVTAALLRIHALSIMPSTVIPPLERMFQILDRIVLVQVRYVATLIGTIAFAYLFVFHLGMDARGIAWAWLCNSAAILVVVVVLLHRCGIMLQWGDILASALFSAGITAIAGVVSFAAAATATGLAALALGTIGYGAVIAVGYLVIRRRLLRILG